MFKNFWKIDPSQGESRFAQLLGIWLLICLIAFFTWHFEGTSLNGTNLISANLSFTDNSDKAGFRFQRSKKCGKITKACKKGNR